MILFEDLILTNCCKNEIQLDLSTTPGQILLEEQVSISHPCTCVCNFPTEALLGPFASGQYVFKVVQIEYGENVYVIGEVPVIIE